MCFELDSLPPIPPLSGGAPVRSDDLTLEAADGNRFAAFAALPDEPCALESSCCPTSGACIASTRSSPCASPSEGFPAVAFDYFGRTAGVEKRDDEFPYMDHVAQTTPEEIQADTRAAVEFLRSPAGGACTAIFTVGFCFGGRNSWLATAAGHGLAGAVGFYGSTGERNGQPGPTQRAAEFKAPILALQAGDDQNILPEHNAAFDAALRPPVSSTSSSYTTARRTASLTGVTPSTPTLRPMRGIAFLPSSGSTRRPLSASDSALSAEPRAGRSPTRRAAGRREPWSERR